MGVFKSFFFCSFLWSVAAEPDYYYNHNMPMNNEKLSDVGVPEYTPLIFKDDKWANAYARSPGTKTAFKFPARPSYGSGQTFSGSKGFGSNFEMFASHERGLKPPGIFSSHMSGEDFSSNYRGGCSDMPKPSLNSILKCNMHSGCTSTCIQGHLFPNGKNVISIVCKNGEWEIQGSEWSITPACEPICLPPCQNNGICISPDQCSCPENFNGPQCQFEKKPCLNYPPLPKNSRRSCSQTSCTISCLKGHQFPDGSEITNLVCKEGNWVTTRHDMHTISDCRPICNPPCLNGGVCLSLNVCQCPQEYRGDQCQYAAEVCAASKLGFNGGYNCSGDANGVSCSLSCPVGIQFSSTPLSSYSCLYSTGIFTPLPIPQCMFGKNSIITVGGSTKVTYHPNFDDHNSMEKLLRGKSLKSFPIFKTGGTYGHSPGYSHEVFENFDDKNFQNPNLGTYTSDESVEVLVENRKPKSGICFTWGGAHYKTFDGKVYSFESECQHVLVRDAKDNTFSINIQNHNRYMRVLIYLQDKEYVFEASKDGGIVFKSTKRQLPIPAQLPGFRVEMAGHMVRATLEAVGVTLKWNAQQFVQVEVTESMWNRTEGLCGRIDGNSGNDMANREGIVPKSTATLANSWLVKKIGGDICDKRPIDQHACSSQSDAIVKKAEKFCSDLITKKKFKECSKIMDISLLLESCKWDYCGCPSHQSRESCGCESLGVYAAQCFAQGVKSLARWRDDSTCAMDCPGGRIYDWCGPSIQLSCGSAMTEAVNKSSGNENSCTEGCFCPVGTLNYNGKCVTLDQCPCRFKGKQYPPGSSIPKDCNTCTCENGEWICSQAQCGARCSAIGDPHYQTFDGKRFNFMGQCSYVLLKSTNFSIEAENVACSGTISEGMGLGSAGNSWEMPSCTKAVSIKTGDSVIELKQGRVVIINGKTMNKLPLKFCDIKISTVSSLFLKVLMPQGIEIWWDGMTRVHIDAPASMHGQTKGLCGTFNSNQKDDFLTPEGDVEQSIIPFANKWKAQEKCEDSPNEEISHPCLVNVQNKATAEKLCGKLKSQLFEECHWNVDVEPFYEDCLYDMCACEGPVDRCLCPILGAYASECAIKGVQIPWRYNVKECELQCPSGQTYQVCGDSCTRSCYDISGVFEDLLDAAEEARCHPRCVEGCNCPPGQTLDSSGECIPIGSCPCRHSGLEFPPQYKEVRPGTKEQELCTCIGAQWECRAATPEEILKYPRAASIKDKCRESHNEEFTPCESAVPLTCKNMHEGFPGNSVDECHPGCQCKKGFVLDSVAKTCVKPEDCPCHHGGRSYSEGQQMQEDCNVCKCYGGKWSCEKRECAGVCSTWGDSHFHTYDSRRYDFQGICSYLLTKGCLEDKSDGFSVEIQNEVCGTSSVTCSKSVTLKVGASPSVEQITFTKDKPLPSTKDLSRIKIRAVGLFIYAEVPHLGIVLQWDKGTRVYVKADPKWKGRMKGLCGNYNDNEADDFQTPSGGALEATAKLFGDSWKLQHHCPHTQDIQDTCSLHPERKVWSTQQCSALKRYPFSQCHTEVPPDEFIERCERDTCACGMGGDCECLCTALAAYSFECASRGVPIKWRSQELCPMQCDETCSNYSPCISACPVETCENTLEYKQLTTMCVQDTCVEGCEKHKKCDAGKVYSNSSSSECVPRSSCKSTCMTLSTGQIILEGEVLEEDNCHTCHCSRGKRICIGQPCSTIPLFEGTTEKTLMEQKTKCVKGWTSWISESTPESVKRAKSSKPYSIEKEAIPSLMQMQNLNGPMCDSAHISDIECRTIENHISAKSTGLEAECDVEKGLSCRQPQNRPCPDFEIRVHCQCEKVNKTESMHMPFSPEPVVVDETFFVEHKTVTPPSMLSQLSCDTSKPHIEHPDDCAKFLHCAPGMGPQQHPNLVEKTCGPHMLYNPKSMGCDWPESVIKIKPKCKGFISAISLAKPDKKPSTYEESKNVLCKKGQVWSECAIPCKKACLYYYSHYLKEFCKPGDECLPGCIDEDVLNIKCGKGFLWRDRRSCVHSDDCTCISHTGKLVKPAEVIKESECEICQCLQNYYTCATSSCDQNVSSVITSKSSPSPSTIKSQEYKEVEVVKQPEFLNRPVKVPHKSTTKVHEREELETYAPYFTTASPPPECHPDRYTSVLWNDELPLGDQAFSASSVLGSHFKPQFAKLNGKYDSMSSGSWSPAVSDKNQYIQIKLNRKEPLYGILMQGSPLYNQYVTSYNVLYSDDGNAFNYVKNKKTKAPQVFRGPIDNITPVKQMFDIPFEAKYIKVIPLTWHDNIAIRLDMIGCTDVEFTSTISATKATTHAPAKHVTTQKGHPWMPYAAKVTKVPTTKGTEEQVFPWVDLIGMYPSGTKFTTVSVSTTPEESGESDESDEEEARPHSVVHLGKPSIPRKVTTSTKTPTVITIASSEEEPKKCVDFMGVGENILPAKSITVSSYKSGNPAQQISILQSDEAWQPLTNSPSEWIQINFLDIRNLTGIKSKGGPKGWVTAYNVQYSADGDHWNPILNDIMSEKIFPANYDKNSDITNYFDMPIQAQYLRVLPIKWKDNIQMRVEPLGCFLPYSEMEQEAIPHFTVGPEVVIEELCVTCDGIDIPFEGCDCVEPKAFNGKECISKMQCPCVVNHKSYSVGATYASENCELCICKLGGISQCEKKKCPKCKEGHISSTSTDCECICSPCPTGHRICPTSDICIAEELWCNGVKNCPDDETDCEVTTESITTSVTESTKGACSTPTCPKGYKLVEKKPKTSKFDLMTDDSPSATGSIFSESARTAKQRYMKYYKGGTKSGSAGGTKGGIKSKLVLDQPIQRKTLAKPTKALEEKPEECIQWRCISTRPPPALHKPGVKPTLPPCPVPKCPTDYIMKLENNELDEYDCPKFSCILPPRQDKVCNVTCRTFNTFDGTEFQYDICDHILARDADDNAWDITVQKNCTKNVCINEIVITQDSDHVRFRPDLSVEYNGYFYTVDQTRKIGFQTQTFIISRLGKSLFFVSSKYGFWVIYDFEGNVKLGASGHLFGRVDGLCGFYNGKQEDDRRKPDGSQAFSTEEFGDSWANDDGLEKCKNSVCPMNIQEQAYSICTIPKSSPLAECASVLDEALSRASCIENTCNCLQSDLNITETHDAAKFMACSCAAHQKYVTECLAVDPTIDLKAWRNILQCPAVCPAPLVYYDCYKRNCEPTCDSVSESEQCQSTPGMCFSGCFCPEGLVRKDDNCLSPLDCRDCTCDSFGRPQYLTFDNRNITFDGKCAYTLLLDKGQSENFKFQIYAAHDKCPHDKKSSCTTAMYLVFKDNTVYLKKNNDKMDIIVNGIKLKHFPVDNDWLQIQRTSENDVNLFVKEFHFDLSLIFHSMAFSIKVPKMFYQFASQGICGDCADDGSEKDIDFAADVAHWRAPEYILNAMGIKSRECAEKPKEECWPLPEEQDPCLKILDKVKFGKCHLVLDPTPYLQSCQQELCSESKKMDVCNTFEVYARECRVHGICLDWRRDTLCPYNCKEDQQYKSCEIGCQVTCDNYEQYENDPKTCSLPPVEGCFCSEEQIMKNGKCIEKSKCSPCDSDGHYVGDKWQLDECTECACSKEGKVTCTERSCAQAMTCKPGLQAQKIAKVPGQCCLEFVCVPEPTKTTAKCPDPIKIKCGFGQNMKLETMSNNCAQYICKCKPPEECETMDPKLDAKASEPGMVKEIDSSGCCPKVKYVCKYETCPKIPKCQKFHKLKYTENPDDCCPKYTCEPLTDKCLYDMEYDAASRGGEIKKKSEEVETLSKSINAIWQDGPCRSCVCKQTNNKLRAVCSVTQCPQISSTEDFEIESLGVPFTCCPQPKYIACKHGNKIYKVDEKWTSETNPCESYKCILKDDGTLEKEKNVKTCNDKCKQGWKYVPSKNPKICCGECVPFACVINNVERNIGEKWTSEDYCTNYVCLDKNGTVQVQSMKVNCPVLSDSQKEEYEFKEIPVDGKCCKINKPIACKANGKKYEIDETWTSKTNPCKSYKCVLKDGESLEKQISIKQCETKCKKGWKYTPPANNEEKCCGECVPFACMVNDKEFKIGEKWISDDYCTNFVCLNKNGALQVQSDRVNCPSIPESQKNDFEFEEIVVKGKCCKDVKPIACKVDDKIYEVDETWESDDNPCKSFKCVSKGVGLLEKQTNLKECDDTCKKGSKYVPSHDATQCCGQCMPYACIVNGIERKIGDKWTSKDYCTNYICLDKNGTVQVQSMKVNCPAISNIQKDDYKFKEIPVEGECCKKIVPVACIINGEIYQEGSSSKAPDGDPCKNVTCTRDINGELVKKESSEACNTECSLGWEYKISNDPLTCCGQCIQTACVVEEVLYKPGQVWYSPDNCTQFTCDGQSGNLVVSSNQDVCPDLSGCNPSNIYVKGCCKYCNITAMSQSSCISEDLPAKDTIGLIQQTNSYHGLCQNKKPLIGFKECQGSCNSGTIYNQESSMHTSDCKCCQVKKYEGLVIEMTCEDGHVFKKQIPIPTLCECQACVGETVSKSTKYGRKIPPKFEARARFAPEGSDLDDVEMIDTENL